MSNTNLRINSIADAINAINNPDLIPDLPEYKVYPNGSYIFDLDVVEMKDYGKDGVERLAVNIQMSNCQVIDLDKPEQYEDLQATTDALTGGMFGKAYFLTEKDSDKASKDFSSFKKVWIPYIHTVTADFNEFMESVLANKQSGSPLQVAVHISKTVGKTPKEGTDELPVYNRIELVTAA